MRLDPRRVPLALLLALWIGPLGACGTELPAIGLEDAHAMRRAWLAGERIEVTVYEEALEDAARRIVARCRDAELPATLVAAGEAGRADAPRLVLGTFDEEEVARLAATFGARPLAGGGFEMVGGRFPLPADFVRAVLPDPDRPGLPLVLVAGVEADWVARAVTLVEPGWRSGVELYRGGTLLRHYRLVRGDDRYHCMERASAEHEPLPLLPTLDSWSAQGFRLYADRRTDAPGVLLEYASRVEAARERALSALGLDPREDDSVFDRLRVLVHDDLESLLAVTGRDAFVHWAAVPALVHVVTGASGVPDDGGAEVARRAVEQRLGPPRSEAFAEALGAWAAGERWGRPLELTALRLVRAGVRPGADELFDVEARAPDRHVGFRALFVGMVHEQRGSAALRGWWEGDLDPTAERELDDAWRVRLERWARQGTDAVAVERAPEPPPWSVGAGGWIAWPDLAGRRALASGRALEPWAELGANLARLAYPVLDGPPEDGWYDLDAEHGWHAGLSDVARIAACRAARRLGIAVALEPRWLESESGRLSGLEVLASEEDWSEWFDEYEAMVLHQALIAEVAGAEWLVLSGEANPALISAPEVIDQATWMLDEDRELAERLAELRLERWLALLERVRVLYGGRLTVLAHSRRPIEVVGFWERLDAVACELFESWPGRADSFVLADQWALEQRMSEVLEERTAFAAERGLPLLVLGAGYPRTARAAQRPWMRAGSTDREPQDTFLRALAALVARGHRDFPGWAGMCLWSMGEDTLHAPERGFELDPQDLGRRHPGLFRAP